ncbi:MAG: zinc ABC transporter substrate-binding protein [SAR324 cluster bacterium]|nr:zinc ABC transporter substrate-binding protein [SAR324 cluster bacterium]
MSNSLYAQPKKQLTVLSSWSILEDVVKQVGGTHIRVISLAPRGIDLHHFKLTPSDHIRIINADWIVWLGLNLEPWLQSSLKGIPKEKHLQLGKQLANLLLIEERNREPGLKDIDKPSEHDHEGKIDPHIWHDVEMIIQVCQLIADGLSKKDPEHAVVFQKNADLYIEKLKSLHQWVHQELSFIPASHRLFVTSHQAFEYFGRAYDFETISPRGLNSSNQASPRVLQQIITKLREREVKVIFQEAHVNPALLKQIARGTDIVIQEELLTGNLARFGEKGATYEGFIRSNVQQIANAFKSYLNI